MDVKRQILPSQHAVSVEPNPLSGDPRSKMLVIELPLEGEQWLLILNDAQITTLHDSTGPGLYMASAGEMPPDPPD